MNDVRCTCTSNEEFHLFEGKIPAGIRSAYKNNVYVEKYTGRINNQLDETHDDIRRGRQGVHECVRDGRQKTRSVKD